MALRNRFALAFLTAFVLAPAGLSQGNLVFEQTSHDFGEINAGDRVMTSFTFANRGDGDLLITAVRPSCGCTVPRFTDSPVEPGASGEVEVAFDATGRSGRVRQSVVVLADVGRAEPVSATLMITAEVVPAAFQGGVMQGGVRFDSDEVDVGAVPAGVALRHRFLMQRIGAQPLAIRAAHSFPVGAEIAYPELPVFREDVIGVEVTLPGSLVTGSFDVMIALETDDPDEPIKALRVFGVAE